MNIYRRADDRRAWTENRTSVPHQLPSNEIERLLSSLTGDNRKVRPTTNKIPERVASNRNVTEEFRVFLPKI
jgi:hypothetical protein